MNEAPGTTSILAQAEDLVVRVRQDRAARRAVRERGRRTRRAARALCERARASKEVALDHRWMFWAAGLLPSVPSHVPSTWLSDADVESTVRRAAQDCAECARTCADARGPAQPVRVALAAACQLAAEGEERDPEELAVLLSTCARLATRLEQELAAFAPTARTVLWASACRRCSSSCRAALTALYPT